MMMHVSFPMQSFNAAVKDGTVGQKIGRILETLKPEAVYFTEQNGSRGAVIVVNVPEPSAIPALAEPWFLTFQAEVQFRIAMTPEDLKKSGLDALAKQWG
jgi:hypothetical protein